MYYILCSVFSAILLSIAIYFANNSPIFLGETTWQFTIIQVLCDKMGISNEVSYGDAVFYNVGYDKELIPAINENDTLGVRVITDRNKLLRFLNILKDTDYKYIIVDLTFEKNDVGIDDDSLFNLIKDMDNIVVAEHVKIPFARQELIEKGKTGLVTYYSSVFNSNFANYIYSIKDRRSIPLHVYEQINHIKLNRYGFPPFPIYTLGGKLCQNGIFLKLDYSLGNSLYSNNSINNITGTDYINLGAFLDNPLNTEELLHNLIKISTKNKYVVIGDFINDMKDTYIGEKPGPLVIMRALRSLEEGLNLVSPFHAIFWFFIFAIISFFILIDKPITGCFLEIIPYKFVRFLLSLLTFTVVLLLCSVVDYVYFDRVDSLAVPVIYFSIIKIIVHFKNKKEL